MASSSPSLIAIPQGFNGFAFWLRAHQSAHDYAASKSSTVRVILDPFNIQDPFAREAWLRDHQRSHDAINNYLKVSGPDLTELNWNNAAEVQAWVDLNFLDHQQWLTALG